MEILCANGRNYVPVIITISSSITVLVHVICLGYFIPMNHGVSKKAPPLPLTRFSPGLFIVLQEIVSTFFSSYRIIANNNAFSK